MNAREAYKTGTQFDNLTGLPALLHSLERKQELFLNTEHEALFGCLVIQCKMVALKTGSLLQAADNRIEEMKPSNVQNRCN